MRRYSKLTKDEGTNYQGFLNRELPKKRL